VAQRANENLPCKVPTRLGCKYAKKIVSMQVWLTKFVRLA